MGLRFKTFILCINCYKLKTSDFQIMLEWISYFIRPFINDRLNWVTTTLKMKKRWSYTLENLICV